MQNTKPFMTISKYKGNDIEKRKYDDQLNGYSSSALPTMPFSFNTSSYTSTSAFAKYHSSHSYQSKHFESAANSTYQGEGRGKGRGKEAEESGKEERFGV